MKGSKEMFEEIREKELSEEKKEENSEYYELIGRLQRKEERLSYSSLKEFGKSPINFIKYKLKDRTPPNESQVFGSLCDCLITEPERFEDLFATSSSTPTTDNQKGFCNDVINGKSVKEAYKLNYKTGTFDKIYSELKDYIDAIKSGKTVITQSAKDQAEKIVKVLKKSELLMQYIDSCDKFQNRLEWTIDGWNFLGFTDCQGEGIIIDLKFTKDANPDKFERDVINYEYYMQMAMYAEATNPNTVPECYFIAYDKSGNFSVMKLDWSFLSYGIRKYKYLLKKLNKCISENRFNESYNFFDDHEKTIYKPKWIKGLNDGEDE